MALKKKGRICQTQQTSRFGEGKIVRSTVDMLKPGPVPHAGDTKECGMRLALSRAGWLTAPVKATPSSLTVGTSSAPCAAAPTACGSAATAPASRQSPSASLWLCLRMARLCLLAAQRVRYKCGRWPSTLARNICQSFKNKKTRLSNLEDSNLWIRIYDFYWNTVSITFPLHNYLGIFDGSRALFWTPLLWNILNPATNQVANRRGFLWKLRTIRMWREPTVL